MFFAIRRVRLRFSRTRGEHRGTVVWGKTAQRPVLLRDFHYHFNQRQS